LRNWGGRASVRAVGVLALVDTLVSTMGSFVTSLGRVFSLYGLFFFFFGLTVVRPRADNVRRFLLLTRGEVPIYHLGLTDMRRPFGGRRKSHRMEELVVTAGLRFRSILRPQPSGNRKTRRGTTVPPGHRSSKAIARASPQGGAFSARCVRVTGLAQTKKDEIRDNADAFTG